MTPLLILVVATVLLRLIGSAAVPALANWRDATLGGVAIMFLFTGATHFSPMKYDYAAMIPPPFTGSLVVIYLTGLLQIAGAIGLLVPKTRKLAGLGLLLLLLGLFPANVYAAMNDVAFRGAPPTEIWLRGFIQAVFVLAVWWSAVAAGRPTRRSSEREERPTGVTSG